MLQRCSSSNNTTFSFLFPASGLMEEACSSPAPVDCTLSLGTPSSRNTTSSSTRPSFCWDVISQSKTQQQQMAAKPSIMGGDPLLLARRCANCDTTSTPLWRNGPRGPKSLCNACGIRYRKEERRAAASSSSSASTLMPAATSHLSESIGYSSAGPWSCYSSSSKAAARHEDMDQVSYLSWRLNVVPPQLHYQ